MKILAFGEVMLRLMVPEHKTLLQSDQLQTLYCGTGVNILAQLQMFNHKTYLATKLPNNNIGKAANGQLRKLGINDEFVILDGQNIGTYFLEVGYGSRASRVTYMNRINSSFCSSKLEEYEIEKMLDGIDAIHICGICLALSDSVKEIALEMARIAREKNILVFFDFNYRPSLWEGKDYATSKIEYEKMLEYTDVIFASSKDAELILGIDTKGLTNQEILARFANQYHLKAIACTKRNRVNEQSYLKGCLFNQNEYVETDYYQLDILDRIGAGDGYAAGIIHGIMEQLDNQKIVNLATSVAVLSHSMYGDIPQIEKDDIDNHLNGKYIDLIR